MAQGYWLNHLYVQELKSAKQGKRYQGKITLSDKDSDEELRELLNKFMSVDNSEEWHEVIPEEAVNWLKDYVPKLAGVLSEDVLEKTRGVLRDSMMRGTTLQERMKALRGSSETLQKMTDARIESIARTEITRADSMGRLISMKGNEDVIGFEFSAIMDDRTTEICAERHGLVMRLDDPRVAENTPPLHVRCRSMLLSLTVYDYPDGVLTSHEFEEVPSGIQRETDIEEFRKILDVHIEELMKPDSYLDSVQATEVYRNTIELAKSILLKELEDATGIKLTDEDMKKAEEQICELMMSDDVHVGIKFDAKVLKKILDSGRFKTQFETNKSAGMLNKRERAKFEGQIMSYSMKLDPKERPVYGMLFELQDVSKVNLTNPNDCSEMYGDTVAFFKKGIKRYTTFTGGDSLDNQGFLLASPMLSPSLESIEVEKNVWGRLFGALKLEEKITLSHCAYYDNVGSNYVEAQIHGGHATIDQIEHIVFGRDVKEKYIPKELLKRHNITWSREKKTQ